MPDPVLVVDDNPQNLKLVQVLLTGAGYQVRTAADADEALHILESIRPALILMDVQLPGMDGIELTRQLKADPRTEGIAVIALSAYASADVRARALAAGCDDYVVKPIDIDGLLETVAQQLAKLG